MSFWSRLFGGSEYKEEELATTIQKTLAEDPLVVNPEKIGFSCDKGVITLTGSVDNTVAKDHIEGAIREALRYKGLKFEQIINNITAVSTQASA